MGYFKSQRQITLSRSKSLRSRFDFGLEYHGSEGSIFTCMHSVIILLSYAFISKKKKKFKKNDEHVISLLYTMQIIKIPNS